MARNIVVIGGGPAAVFAAIEAKKRDAAANVTLVTDEACEPYEKPPLSKAVLLGKANPEDAPIAGPGRARQRTASRSSSAPAAPPSTARRARSSPRAAALPYDALVIATGSLMRELPLLPPGMPRVHYLRTEAHARALKAGARGVQASGRDRRRPDRARGRGLGGRARHRGDGDRVRAAHHGARLRRGDRRASSWPSTSTTASSSSSPTVGDAGHAAARRQHRARNQRRRIARRRLVVVGTGVKPDDALAAAAGLDVQDGIVVDAQCRTSDPDYLRRRRLHALPRPARRGAAGELAARPGPRRGRRPQRRRRQRQLQRRAVVLDRAVRPLHPGRRLARSRRAEACAGRCRTRARCCLKSRTASRPMRSASTRSAISPRCAG